MSFEDVWGWEDADGDDSWFVLPQTNLGDVGFNYIPPLAKPVTLTSFPSTILLDNFTGSYTMTGIVPQVSFENQTWGATVVGAFVPDVAATGNYGWGGNGDDTFLQEAKLSVGYYTPANMPPDSAAEFRMKMGTAYFVPANIFSGEVIFTAELCAMYGVPTGSIDMGLTFNPSGSNLHSSLGTITAPGLWLVLTAQTGNDSVGAPVIWNTVFMQLPLQLALRSAYLVEMLMTATTLSLQINGVVYATLNTTVLPSGWTSLNANTCTVTIDRRSFPGSVAAVDPGGFHSIRLGSIVQPPNPLFWGEYLRSFENP